MSESAYKRQDFRPVTAAELSGHVQDLIGDGYRLGQICGTTVAEGCEILYSFDKDHTLVNLQVVVPDGEDLTSITNICWSAFIYENEIQDLFGVKFKHSVLDYGGKLYKVTEPTPWNPKK